MKTFKNPTLFILVCRLGISFASIPSTYIANYDIENDRENVSKTFIEIEASNKIGEETSYLKFGQLNQSFQNLFPKLPQEYTFQVIYQQCLQLSKNLSQVYNKNTFSSFMDNCYKPLSTVIGKINSSFTVNAKISANPNKGSAPLSVTFDARASYDPSNETIPSSNFFWYYRNTKGEDKIIGNLPVINHVFDEAGNYIVHLTVRSSNKDNGIIDGHNTISIDVNPKAAIISVFANSKKLKKFEKIKFGTQEGQKGIVLDGSATIAIGGRQILSHSREVTSSDGFKFYKPGEGLPGVIKVILPKDGEYKVTLKTIDNEGNNISEQYYIIISDPVAIIKKEPSQGNTSNTFVFDSSASYSIMSSIKLFTREVFDNQGDKIQTFQGKTIKNQFKKPGSYTVKLSVEDELGQVNSDIEQIYIESSVPIAQFTIKQKEDREYPSRFVFDAGLSFDIDVENGYDDLEYIRTFSNSSSGAKIMESKENNKIIDVVFDSIGEHKIKLTVKDKYGKMSEIEKQISVRSTLRPVISILPKAITWGNIINFVVNSNQEIASYTRDFGDGDSITTQSNKITHVYKKMGHYKIKLMVYGVNGTENSIVDNVFIGDKNFPIAAYKVTSNNNILKQNEECFEATGSDINYAYKLERYQRFNIDTKDSVNIKGENNNLNFYFQPKNADITKTNNFTHSFDELGCQYIDLTVEDISIGVNDKIRIWFKIYNSLPSINNLVLNFPQYGNEMGVGFNENQVKDIFNTEFDPLIVKVQAVNPVDPDGFISYFKRYYYYKDDPDRIIETKITPGNISYTFFSLPKRDGEFMFGVTMYDNDGGLNQSENIIGNGPIVFFPPDTKRPDIPMVTLKSNKTTVDVGDEVTFEVISKIISDRSDFIQERTIYYDFDGDGERDLISKKDKVTYIYQEANDVGLGYIPRAAVTYRGYKGIGIGGNIIVKKGLKPRLLTEYAGRFVLFRDVSLGEIEKSITCLDIIGCKQNDESFAIDTKKNPIFTFEYPEYTKYIVYTDIEDKYANKVTNRQLLNLTGVEVSSGDFVNYTGDFKMLSIPSAQELEDGSLEVLVGKSLNNSVAFYILFDDPEHNKKCYVDLDVNDDKDKDFDCNQVFFTKFEPRYDSIIGKIHYQSGSQLKTKDLKISFIDFSIELEPDIQIIYEKINRIIDNIKDESLKYLLTNLQKGLIDPTEIKSNVVALQNYLLDEQNTITISDSEKEELQRILNELSDATTISAMGGSEYEIAKSEILQILPSNLKLYVENLFYDFENITNTNYQEVTQNKQREVLLNNILATIEPKIAKTLETHELDEIAKEDMDNIIMPNICKIARYYDIAMENCESENTKIIDESSVKAEKTHKSGLKILLVILSSFIGIFVLIIVIFAIKAKIKQRQEYEEEVDNDVE